MDPDTAGTVTWLTNGVAFTAFREYPVASPRTFVSFSAELISVFTLGLWTNPFIVPAGGTVEFQLFHGVTAVPSFLIVYMAGEGGIKAAIAPIPEAFAVGDTFSVRCMTTGFSLPNAGAFSCSATIGIL